MKALLLLSTLAALFLGAKELHARGSNVDKPAQKLKSIQGLLAISPDFKTYVAYEKTKPAIVILELSSDKPIASIGWQASDWGWPHTAVFDEEKIAVFCGSSVSWSVILLNRKSGEKMRTIRSDGNFAGFSPDARYLQVYHPAKPLLYDLTDQKRQPIVGPAGVWRVVFSKGEVITCMLDDARKIARYKVLEDRLESVDSIQLPKRALAASDNHRNFVLANNDIAELYSLPENKIVHSWAHPDTVLVAAVQGNLVATLDNDRVLRVWKRDADRPIAVLKDVTIRWSVMRYPALRFSTDGTMVIVHARDIGRTGNADEDRSEIWRIPGE